MSGLVGKVAVTDPAGLGSGLLTGIGATLAKVLPAGFLAALLPFAAGAGIGLATWVSRAEEATLGTPGPRRPSAQASPTGSGRHGARDGVPGRPAARAITGALAETWVGLLLMGLGLSLMVLLGGVTVFGLV